MNQKIRHGVHDKYGGRCAYCGRTVPYNKFQVDHMIPQARSWVYKNPANKDRYKAKCDNIDSFENLMPSCRRCNHYKRSRSLETFRRLMKTIHKRLADVYIFKVAVDYGIVQVEPFNGVFYFEKEDTCYGKNNSY